jgi:hypothetical protein
MPKPTNPRPVNKEERAFMKQHAKAAKLAKRRGERVEPEAQRGNAASPTKERTA